MGRIIVLDSFPLSCMGKLKSDPATVTDHCREWVMRCIAADNWVLVPAVAYYETLRELERLNAAAQIARLKAFCFADPVRLLPLETGCLEEAAKLWGRARNAGRPTADPHALDGDVILAAQVQLFTSWIANNFCNHFEHASLAACIAHCVGSVDNEVL